MPDISIIKEAAQGIRPTKEKPFWEPHQTHFVRNIVKPGNICIDIGAKSGWYSLLCAYLAYPDGYVYAVEPLENHVNALKANLHEAGNVDRTGVDIVEAMISDYCGSAKVQREGTRGFILKETEHVDFNDRNTFPTQIWTFDELWVNKLGRRPIDFIKCDIDGHEVRFLRGAKTTLKKFNPIMMLEFGWPCRNVIGDDLNEGVEILQDLGYSFFDVRGNRLIPDPNAPDPFPIRVGSGIDVACIPQGKTFPKMELL